MASIDTIADRSAGSTVAGKAYFETSTNKFIVYNGSSWVDIDSDGTGAVFSNQYSVSLDGTNDYLELASTITLPDGPRTISAWVNFSNVSGTYNTILGAAPAGGSYGDRLGLHMSPSNGLFYFLDVDQTPRYKVYTGSITTNTWYHLMVVDTDSGAEGNFKMYVNGTDIGIPAERSNTTAPRAMEFSFIGKGKNNFPGLIDEVAIWNSDQSANLSEIRDTSGANPVPGNLSLMSSQPLHWWRMGENDSGSTVTDQGSGGVDANFANATSFSTDVPS